MGGFGRRGTICETAERGIVVTHESIRHWCRKFGADFARRLRDGGPGPETSGTSTRCSSGSWRAALSLAGGGPARARARYFLCKTAGMPLRPTFLQAAAARAEIQATAPRHQRPAQLRCGAWRSPARCPAPNEPILTDISTSAFSRAMLIFVSSGRPRGEERVPGCEPATRDVPADLCYSCHQPRAGPILTSWAGPVVTSYRNGQFSQVAPQHAPDAQTRSRVRRLPSTTEASRWLYPRFFMKEGNLAANNIDGVAVPDSKMAQEVTQLIRDTESELLFYHSTRVYFWGALTGKRMGLMFDRELLYTGAMFHDIGLTQKDRRKPASLRSGWCECRARLSAKPRHF